MQAYLEENLQITYLFHITETNKWSTTFCTYI